MLVDRDILYINTGAPSHTHLHTNTHTPHTHTHTTQRPTVGMLLYCAAELTELFKEHKFVGCVDQTRALVQFLVSCLGPLVGDSTVSCVSSYVRTVCVCITLLSIHLSLYCKV